MSEDEISKSRNHDDGNSREECEEEEQEETTMRPLNDDDLFRSREADDSLSTSSHRTGAASPPPSGEVIARAEGAAAAEDSGESGSCGCDSEKGSLPPLEVLDDEEEGGSVVVVQQRTTYWSSLKGKKRYIFLAFALWVAQLVLVIALKRAGLVEPEFQTYEAVSQMAANVRLPMQLEQILLSRLNESIPLAYLTQEKKRPGFHLAQEGARAHFPIIMVPGFVTSGLEVWGGKPCARKHFRQRLWAALGGARSFLTDKDCWRDHMQLDPVTGGDPDDIRLRAAAEFEAADYFLGNYWVWGKLIENLADVGYTPSTMKMEPYDWRLAFPLLEERDGYFTKLKSSIEDMHVTTGKKVVLTSHSMGALVVHYFFAWVTTGRKRGGGGGGRNWVERHVHAYVNIAGSHLGVPKAATAMLSGEMSDTVIMGVMGNMVEQFFGRRLRRDLWITWGSLWAMLPKGGDALWGAGADMCDSRSAEDPFCPEIGLSPLLAMTTEDPRDSYKDASIESNATSGTVCDAPWSNSSSGVSNFFSRKSSYLTQDVFDYLRAYRPGGEQGPVMSGSRVHSLYGEEKPSSRTWHDPTRTPLPRAPNMRIYCLYGTGLDTERAYYYRHNYAVTASIDNGQTGSANAASTWSYNQTDEPPVVLDTAVNDEAHRVKYGVRFADGDGSVPLLSLGYICVDRWTDKHSGLNPSGSPVTTREYKHQSEFVVDDLMRGGPRSSDHVDILGNHYMTADFLRIVTNWEPDEVQQNRIVSDIEKIAADIAQTGTTQKSRKPWWLP